MDLQVERGPLELLVMLEPKGTEDTEYVHSMCVLYKRDMQLLMVLYNACFQ